MVGVLFLLNQYVHARLDSAVLDMRAIRYGSGYLVGIQPIIGNYRILHINNLGQVIRADYLYGLYGLNGLVIDRNGKPLAYGGSSSSAFYFIADYPITVIYYTLPPFKRAVRTSNYLYFVSYKTDTVFFFRKDSSNYWRLKVPYSVTAIDVAYEDAGKKIYLLIKDNYSFTTVKMDESLNVILARRHTLAVSDAFIDVQGRFVAVGYRTTSTTGVLLLDTALNTVRHFQIDETIFLSGVRLYGGKIYLYGAMGKPEIAILDTSGNLLSFVKDNIVPGNVRFLDPENSVAIYTANVQAFFRKTNPTFLGTCGMSSATASVSTLPNPSYTTLSLPLIGPDTVSLLLPSPISKFSYTPDTNLRCFSEPFTVVFTVPDSGDINVPLSANIGVWFSKPINDTTINASSVSITGWDGSSFRNYSFTTTCPMPNFCVLDPILNFRPNEEITVRFNSAIRDTSGNPLVPKVIVFRTQGVDTLNPVVVFTTPDSGAVNVPSNTKIAVQFSRDMDTTTINPTNVIISGSSSGSHSFTKVCRTLSYCEINPGTFNVGETVTVEFRSGIMALNGRNLVPRIITFTTGTPDNTPPNITIISGPNDTIVLYDRSIPIKAYVWDNYRIQRVEWVINSQTYISPTNCNGNIYRNPDTSCFYIPDIPTGTYTIIAYAYDYSGNVGIDTAYLKYQDTIKPYVVFTDPRDNSYGISPTPLITVVFSEGMDTTSGSLEIRVGSSTYPYTKYWEDLRTLKIGNTTLLPYDSTVKVVLRNYRDISGNTMVGDSFSFRFTIISNAEIFIRILNVNPNTVYKGSPDSTYILAEVSSRYNIRGAKMVINGSVEVPMFAKDGSFDEPVETVYVRYRFGELEVGEYNVSVKAWNDYVARSSEPFIIKVKSIGFLDKENVVIYPNPAKGQAKLRVIFGANTNAVIEVFDLKVKRVYYREGSFDGFKTYEFELPKLPTGLYLVRVRAGDKKVEKWFSVIK